MSLDLHTPAPRHARSEAGQMTAVMRAATQALVPKVLRVAVVVEGRIVEERIFRERTPLDTTFFERDRQGYWLRVPSGAVGRIVTREGQANIGPHAARFRLDDSARGKIVLGKSSVLFQFVVPPPEPTRPQLPLATQRAEIDWSLTIIVAFSFLAHFGFIGSMFSDWLDPVSASDDAVVSLIDMTRSLPPASVEDSSAAGSTPQDTPSATPAKPTASRVREHESSDARAASLAREADAMRMGLLSALGSDVILDGALRRGDIPLVDLEGVARSKGGAETTSSELTLVTGTGVWPGSHNLRGLGVTQVGPMTEGRTRDPVGPKVDVTLAALPTGHGDAFDHHLDGPIARLRPSFRACYERKGVSVDPTMEGKITLDIHIASNGDVADVTKVDGSGLSSAVEQCIIERTRHASFDAVGGSGVHARVPIVFRHQ